MCGRMPENRAGVALTAFGRSGQAVAVPSDKCVHRRPQPARRWHSSDASHPCQPGKRAEQGNPRRESLEPGAIRCSNMHLVVEFRAREGSLCRHSWIVVVQKPQPRVGIVRFNLLPRPPAERAGAVHEDVVSRGLWHCSPRRAPLLSHRPTARAQFPLRFSMFQLVVEARRCRAPTSATRTKCNVNLQNVR
jgi:hypothetical protein